MRDLWRQSRQSIRTAKLTDVWTRAYSSSARSYSGVLLVGLWVKSILGLEFSDDVICRVPGVSTTGLSLLRSECCGVAAICEIDRWRERDGVEEPGVPADQPELLSDFRGFALAPSSFVKNAGKVNCAGLYVIFSDLIARSFPEVSIIWRGGCLPIGGLTAGSVSSLALFSIVETQPYPANKRVIISDRWMNIRTTSSRTMASRDFRGPSPSRD